MVDLSIELCKHLPEGKWYVSPWPKQQNTGDGQDVLEVIHRFEHVEHAAPWCWRLSLVEMMGITFW